MISSKVDPSSQPQKICRLLPNSATGTPTCLSKDKSNL